MKFLALGEIVEILDSKRRPISKKDRKQGPYPYYGATGIVDYIDGYIFDEELVLVGEDGAKWKSMDNTAFTIKGKTWVNNHAHVLRPNNEIVLNQFLIYYLRFKDLSEFVKGITVPKLNQTNLKLIPIPVPSLQEQEKIVERLDSISQPLKIYKKNKSKISTFFEINKESYLLHIFKRMIAQNEWDMKNLQDLNKVVVGYVGPISSAYTHDGSGIPLLSTKNISFDGLSLKKETKVLESFHNKNNKSQLNPGDIIVARHGNSGQSAVIPDTLTKSHALNVIIIKKSRYINPKYLNYLLNSGILIEINKSKAGSVQQIINTKIIRDLRIPLPPIGDQNILVDKIEKFLNVLNDLKAIEIEKFNLSINLEKSTLSKEFSYE